MSTDYPFDGRQEVIDIFTAVANGELETTEADLQLNALDFTYGSDFYEELSTKSPTWYLSLAVIFYSWRHIENTDYEGRRFRRWSYALWSDTLKPEQHYSLFDAEAALKQDLYIGIVRSFGNLPDGSATPIHSDEWSRLSFHKPARANKHIWGASDNEGNLKYWPIYVLRHDLVPLFLLELGPSGATPAHPRLPAQTGSKVKRPGAPLKYDWASAGGYIVKYLVENDYPKHQAELVTILLAWFESQGKQPDRRDAERFVEAAYDLRAR